MDKKTYKIIMKKANGGLMTALRNSLQADMGGTTEQADVAVNHIMDILDAHKEYTDPKASALGDVMVFELRVCTGTSDGKPVKGTERDIAVFFNQKVISTEEVKKLIENGGYEHDIRVVVTSLKQGRLLRGMAKIADSKTEEV
ncbi:MAG: hypothetical protein UGF89_12690 [Acutalibacteraceae bacterium]|nr:hypothetical protein [Acutalibacteraceae bacterium]